jgi:hypothetical protein
MTIGINEAWGSEDPRVDMTLFAIDSLMKIDDRY